MSIDQHDYDEDGHHDDEGCYHCWEKQHGCVSECRCGDCCRSLILEADVRDAENEPRIATECQPFRDIGPEVAGYRLNDPKKGNACHFLDLETNLCSIYATRPLMCRVFNCDVDWPEIQKAIGMATDE